MSVRGYDIIDMEEYMNSFDDISSAPDRLMRRIVQSIATNALKTFIQSTYLVNLQVLHHTHTSSVPRTTIHLSTTPISDSWYQPQSTN